MRLRSLYASMIALAVWGLSASDAIGIKNHFSIGLERDQKHRDSWLALNWQPQFSLDYPLGDALQLSGEYSIQNRLLANWQDSSYEAEIKLDSYRWWLRLATDQTQFIAGLQRLNFGSSMILRPLRWFDTIDPLDANQETQGVKAALLRHNWLNNTNIWLWAMPGSDTVKGMESYPGKDEGIELGGRLQIPNPAGEMAVSYHQRELFEGREIRLGIDHRYDGPIGLWFEASGSLYQDQPAWILPYTVYATLGGDYTLGIGNGLAFTVETMILAGGEGLSTLVRNATYSSLMGSYPLGLLDSLTLLGSWNWSQDSGGLSLLWRRTYDYLSVDLGASLDKGLQDIQSRSPFVFVKINYDL